MTDFTIYSTETAPSDSKPILDALQKSYGQVANMFGVLAESPKVLEAYTTLNDLFKATSLTTIEQHVVWLTINYENNCGYCMPAHTGLANLDKVPDDIIDAIRDNTVLDSARLEALRLFTRQMVTQRGWLTDDEVNAFMDAGYTRQHILEVILGLAHKTISNYTNHIAVTPVDAIFQNFAWEKPDAAVAA